MINKLLYNLFIEDKWIHLIIVCIIVLIGLKYIEWKYGKKNNDK